MFQLVSINDIFQEFDKQTNKQTKKKETRRIFRVLTCEWAKELWFTCLQCVWHVAIGHNAIVWYM